jgi:ribose 5-phosphate isomerase A
MTNNEQKKQAAKAALQYIQDDQAVGVGSGSTVEFFIEALASYKNRIEGAVASSEKTAQLLKAQGIRLLDLNNVRDLPIYVDGADEVDPFGRMIKGGGGALTREKIIAAVAKEFICIVDESKSVALLGKFPLAIEVIPMARSFVAREIVKLSGRPVYREGFKTDNGNIILDVFNLNLVDPIAIEEKLNQITGVVAHGLFAKRKADKVIIGEMNGGRLANLSADKS